MYGSDVMMTFRWRCIFEVVCVCVRIGRQMNYYDYTPTVHFRVIWQKNEEKTKYRVFYEDSESVFGFSIKCTVLML